MRRVFQLVFGLALITAQAFAVSIVTGNVQDLGGNPVSNVTVRFTLRGCKTTPRMVGTGLPVKLTQDFVSDSSGHISGTIVRNDEITCQQLNDTFYEISLVPAVPDMQPLRTKINTGSFDLSTAQDIAVATAPFIGLNVLLNPAASQIIRQSTGSNLGIVGDGYALTQQGATNAEHGVELDNVDASQRWRLGQISATDPTYPANSFILRSSDVTGNNNEDFVSCVRDGETTGLGSCKLLALLQASPAAKTDMTAASHTSPFQAGTVLPATCSANIEFYDLTNGTGGQKLYVCNGTGNGWLLVGDGGAASSVTSFAGRQGDIAPAPGDYSSVSETLTNKTIDTANNVLITRVKAWLQGAGCTGATASALADTPASGGVTATCTAGTTNTDLNIGSLTYVDGSSTTAVFTYSLPGDFQASGSVDVRLHWMQTFSTSNPAQNVKWEAAVACAQNGNTLDVAWNAVSTVVSASAAKLQPVDASMTTLDSTNCAGTATLFLRIRRIGADVADTMTGSAQLLGAELTYVRTQ